MKRILYLVAITATLWSCSTEQNYDKNSTNRTIGFITNTPDMKIVELDQPGKWQYYTTPMGLRNPNDVGYYSIFPDRTTGKPKLYYPCYISNEAPIDYSGKNDLVINKETDGIPEGNWNYTFPGLLSITTFRNGIPIGEVEKQYFDVLPTDVMVGYDFSKQIRWDVDENGLYDSNIMMIPAGTADNYNNSAIVEEGLNLIVVEVNPDKLINERDYTNNVATLPVRVGALINSTSGSRLGTAVLDLAAIEANKTRQAFNIVVTKNFKGVDKYVHLNWDCAYHDGVTLPDGTVTKYYVKHHFTVKRNGIIIAEDLHASELKIKELGSFKSVTYEIIINVAGLGNSEPVIINVKK